MDSLVSLRRALAGICRHLGRIVGVLVALVILLILISESVGARALPPLAALVPLCAIVLGLIVAFRWPVAGALVALAGYAGMSPRAWLSPLLFVPVAAALHVLGWLLGRNLPPAPEARRGRRVVWVVWTLALLVIVLIGLALSFWPQPLGTAGVAQAGLEGTWQGRGHIAQVWVGPRRRIPVTLVVHADGTADATIGEAHLAGARMMTNRDALGCAGRTYTLSGTLSGPIVPEWGLVCDKCTIGFGFDNGTLHGGVSSSCTEGSGKHGPVSVSFGLRR